MNWWCLNRSHPAITVDLTLFARQPNLTATTIFWVPLLGTTMWVSILLTLAFCCLGTDFRNLRSTMFLQRTQTPTHLTSRTISAASRQKSAPRPLGKWRIPTYIPTSLLLAIGWELRSQTWRVSSIQEYARLFSMEMQTTSSISTVWKLWYVVADIVCHVFFLIFFCFPTAGR